MFLDEEGHNECALWILDLSYNTKQLQSLNKAFSCLQATSDCVNCVMVAALTGHSGKVVRIK